MVHYWMEIKKRPNTLFAYNVRECEMLRHYVDYQAFKKNYKEAKKALASIICLTNQTLYRCSIETPQRDEMMEQALMDMAFFQKLNRLDRETSKEQEVEKPKQRDPNDKIEWHFSPQTLEGDAAEGYQRFKSFIQLPTDEISTWDKVIGHDDAKKFIESSIKYPLLYKKLYKGESMARGVLLFGPPGTGKTMLASSIAAQIGLPYLQLKCTSMSSKWIGETEQNIRYFFALAQHLAPCVVFLDEVDTLAGQRDDSGNAPESRRGIVNQLLTTMDETKDIFVVAATNYPWQIDTAFARRLATQLYIQLPTKEERLKCIKAELEKVPNNLLDIDIRALNDKLDFFSNDDIKKWMRAIFSKRIDKLIRCKYFAKTSKGVWYPTTSINPKSKKITYRELDAQGEEVDITRFSLIDFERTHPIATAKESLIQKYDAYNACLMDPSASFF